MQGSPHPLAPGPAPSPAADRLDGHVWLLRLLAVTIVVVAGGLRLWRLDLTIFEVDEAAIVRLAEDLVRLGRVPLSGPVFSAGIPSAPDFLYLMAPVVAISRDPAFVAGAISVANVLGIGATVWLGWRAFGPLAGLTAGALYAVNPRATFYARHIWQPEVLPPLAVLLFIALDLAVIGRRVWWAAATFPIVALAAQIHPSFATLAPLLLAPSVVLLRMRRWVPLVVGVGLACLTTIPYLIHMVQTHWIDVVNVRYYSSLHTWIDLDSVRYALSLATGLGAQNDPTVPPLDRAFPGALVVLGEAVETALLVGAILLGIGLLVGSLSSRYARSTVVRRDAASDRFGYRRLRLAGVLLWLLLPVVLTIRHTLPLQAHYYLLLYPAPYLLIGAGCAWLSHKRDRAFQAVRFAVVMGLVGAVLIQGVAVGRTLGYIAVNDEPCLATLLPTPESAAQEMVELGKRAGTTRAAVELAAPDSLPLAYLLRSYFPAVDLAGSGEVGLGTHMPFGSAPSSPLAVAPVLTTVQSHVLNYQSGLQLVEVAYSDRPRANQRVTLGLTWHAQSDASSNHAFVWDVALVDQAGHTAFSHSGVDHVLTQLQGQPVVSWLAVDPTQTDIGVLAPGTYRLQLRLIDAWEPAVVSFTDPQDQQTDDVLNIGSVAIPSPSNCSKA